MSAEFAALTEKIEEQQKLMDAMDSALEELDDFVNVSHSPLRKSSLYLSLIKKSFIRVARTSEGA